jgi:diguanylate cyclase (GGDEF)-like protein
MVRKKNGDTIEMSINDLMKKDPEKFGTCLLPWEGKFTIGFTVIQGKEIDFGKHFNFSERSIVIGRNKSNHICLEDEKVSKRHCEINIIRKNEAEQVMVKDMGSTNGTFLNGKSINQAVLEPGDKIGIGDTMLQVSYNDDIEEEYHTRLFTLAVTDSLTGLYNHRYIFNELENQCKIARRNNRIFSLVILDIDNFKQLNDTYGHLAGDDYLKRLSFVINQSLREQDICGRVGGEEFLIILPETRLEGACNMANRIRRHIEKIEVSHRGHTIKTTISAGISQFDQHISDSRTLFEFADLALQKAKKAGKNRIITTDAI